jgi:hypothetical protein
VGDRGARGILRLILVIIAVLVIGRLLRSLI